MDELLKEIYFINESLLEKIKPNEEYKRLRKKADAYYDKLFEILSGEPKKWLDETWLLEGSMQSEWGFTNFQAGFKYGLHLLAQTFTASIPEKSSDIE